MDLDTVFSRLAAGLSSSGYRFRGEDLTPDVLGAGSGLFALHPSGDARQLQDLLDEIRGFAPLAAYRYVHGQPYVVAAVGADGRTDDERVQIAARFDAAMLRMRELAAVVGGIQLGKANLLGARVPANGILLFVFFDPAAAARFLATTRARCKFSHFWKKTYVLPWTVDVPRGQVVRHAGRPFILPRFLDPAVLATHVFAAHDPVAPPVLPHGGASPVR